jgi:2-polyprenyl-3-methyl-5-hydroxy-6-metoxy-1,4-benzoquinol methylase
VLDVGCGLGGFGYALRRVDPTRTIWGIETDPGAAERAAPHYDKVLVGPFPDVLAGHDAAFDCLVFNDVLEHLVDPWTALGAGVRRLSPGGTVLASIPNVRFVGTVLGLVLRGDWSYADTGVLDRTHLRFFTRKTAVSLFRGCGLDVDLVRGIHWIGHSRSRLSRVFPLILGDFACTDLLLRGRRRQT